MLNGPLAGKLILFAIPVAICSIFQQLFNSADAAVAGQLLGNEALAAVGACATVIGVFLNLFIGLSVGVNAVLASCIGSGDTSRLPRAIHTSMVVALVSGVLLVAIGFFFGRPILIIMCTPDDVIDQAVLYLQIYFCSMPFMMLYNFASAILRSKGDTRRSMVALALCSLLNIGLDLGAVWVLNLGIEGIAGATVLSYAVAAVAVMAMLMGETDEFRFSWRRLCVDGSHLRRILVIGVPAGVQVAVFSLANMCVQSGINSFGASAISGSAAELNYEFVTYYIAAAFGQAAVTFVAQNYAARQLDRCRRIVRLCFLFGAVFGAITSIIFTVWAPFYIGVFATDAAAIAYGCRRMLFIEMLEFLTTSYEVAAGAMRGLGQSLLPAIIAVVGSCLFRFVWMATVFQAWYSYDCLNLVYPVTWVITGSAMIFAYTRVRRRAFDN